MHSCGAEWRSQSTDAAPCAANHILLIMEEPEWIGYSTE